MLLKSRPKSTLSLWIILMAITVIAIRIFNRPIGMPMSWDAFGYYLYLPLTFIHGDLAIQDYSIIEGLMDQYNISETFYQAHKHESGNWVIRYPSGWAVLNSPFYFGGHWYAGLAGYEQNGFTLPYRVAIVCSALSYTFLGLWNTRKILLEYFSDKVTTITLVLLVFGTNFFHQSTSAFSLTHVYLFGLFAVVIRQTILWHQHHSWKHILILGLVLGLSIITRPTALVFCLVPLLWSVKNKAGLKAKWQLIKTYRNQIITAIGMVTAIGFIQLNYWHNMTGEWLYDSYNNPAEGLDFFYPHTWNTLFSFRKGWYLYTPIMLLATIGLFLFRQNRWALVVFFGFNLWLVSSWTNWWYAESFSQRAMVDSYPLMGIGMAAFLAFIQQKSKAIQGLVGLLLVLLLGLNLFQTWQIDNGILHGSRMTQDYYLQVFGKTSVTAADRELLLIDRDKAHAEGFINREDYDKKELGSMRYSEGDCPTDSLQSLCKDNFVLSSQQEFSSVFRTTHDQITDQDHAWIRCRFRVFPLTNERIQSAMVLHYNHSGEAYYYHAFGIGERDLNVGEWNTVDIECLTPPVVRRDHDEVVVYFWHQGGPPVIINDLEVEVFEP